MGEAEIIVGCPHRLRSPIGPNTQRPCAACAALGVPPRWAIANTVDRPRLSEIATAVRAVPSPLPAPEIIEAFSAVSRAMEAHAARVEEAMKPLASAMSDALANVRVSPGSMTMNVVGNDDLFARNQFRIEVMQTMYVRGRMAGPDNVIRGVV